MAARVRRSLAPSRCSSHNKNGTGDKSVSDRVFLWFPPIFIPPSQGLIEVPPPRISTTEAEPRSSHVTPTPSFAFNRLSDASASIAAAVGIGVEDGDGLQIVLALLVDALFVDDGDTVAVLLLSC
ncbi:hypothetical protein RIF29_00800 [Crotalaria pallida]|uniref:Uncharacterized protein n=1 Tax=Crotalaria pallida TaxID=3830 RepID=A0AAN9IWM2_CROPI